MNRLENKNFDWRGIHSLHEKWAKVVASEGQYFE